jgi:hypothetical protein
VAQSTITRKNLINSLITGLVIGLIAGIPLGWIANQYFVEKRLAETLICRERNSNQPEAVIQSICGSRF